MRTLTSNIKIKLEQKVKEILGDNSNSKTTKAYLEMITNAWLNNEISFDFEEEEE